MVMISVFVGFGIKVQQKPTEWIFAECGKSAILLMAKTLQFKFALLRKLHLRLCILHDNL